jgi:hypothetical protein
MRASLLTDLLVETSGIEINVPFLMIVLENVAERGYGRWRLSWPESWREKTAFVKMRRCREKFKGIQFRHDHKKIIFVLGLTARPVHLLSSNKYLLSHI